jgi:hypothetical protein
MESLVLFLLAQELVHFQLQKLGCHAFLDGGFVGLSDKSCLKVARNGQTNLLIYKPAIKYMFKEGENRK